MLSRYCIGFFLIAVSVNLSSCSSDLDIIQDYPSTPLVYAAIDPHDSIHFVRVGKTFKVFTKKNWDELTIDSIQYKDVDVVLYGKKENTKIWAEKLVEITTHKDTGFFPSEGASVFMLDHKLPIKWSTDDPLEYYSYPDIDSLVIEVTIPEQDIVTRASTSIMISNGIINYKSRTTLYVYGSKPSYFGIPSTGESASRSGAPVYKQINFTVHFKEVFESHIDKKMIKWSANTGWDGNGYAVTPERFFSPMQERLANSNGLLHRILDSVDVTVLKTSDFYNEYWAIKDKWDAYDRPPYTNFNNSYGMFITIAKGIVTGLQLNWQAADSLYGSKKYESMKFVR